jgi:hypothetical protein
MQLPLYVKLIVVPSENVFKRINFAMVKRIDMMEAMNTKTSVAKCLRIKSVVLHPSSAVKTENALTNQNSAITSMTAVIKVMNRANVFASAISKQKPQQRFAMEYDIVGTKPTKIRFTAAQSVSKECHLSVESLLIAFL